uniref:Pre-mRNA-processing factor 39 n=1 Tax=Kalanchoe fedtschenkoi TaxID=63787 RepID=A0A7N0U2W6_KALFE
MDLLVAGEESEALVDDLRLDVITDKPSDFDSWTSLISHVEKLYADDEEKICSTYDSFLSDFPLCYGYWRKYAAHRIRLCTFDKILEVFERAVQAVAYSVDVWLDYCVFCMSLFPDPNDVRRQFKRGLLNVGRDYSCHKLWDKYIEFEFSQQDWSALAHIYVQILRYPKKMLRNYYERFTQLVAMFKEEMEHQGAFVAEIDSMAANEVPAVYKDDEILGTIEDLLSQSDNLSKSNAWRKYKLIGESLYRKSSLLDEKIQRYENQIRRPYFHVKPLNESELENWHCYLDFVEKQGDLDWAVKLYERCLIPCALYTDFWIRYAQLLENKGGRELANFALDRATKTFRKTVPCMHLFNARYKEQTKDFSGARAAFPKLNKNELDSEFINNVMREANMEKRLGNNEAAYRVYREAIELMTKRQDSDMLSRLYIHYSQLTYKATNRVDAALGVLADGIKQIPNCKSLLKELIKFGMMHGGPKDMNAVDSIVADVLSSEESEIFCVEEKEYISSFYLEFVDLCGTIDDVMKAWTRHIRLFPYSVRTVSNGKPPIERKYAEVAAQSLKELCLDAPPTTCTPGSFDQPQIENLSEPGERDGSEGDGHNQEKLGIGSVPSSNSLAVPSTADLSVQDTDKVDPMREGEGSVKPSEIQHEDDHGIEQNLDSEIQREDDHGTERNLNSLCLEGVDGNNGDKGSAIVDVAQDVDRPDLEDSSRKRTHENTLSADQHLSETRDGASSDSSQVVRGNPSTTADQRLVHSSLSPAGTPRSESSQIPRPFRDNSNEGFKQGLQGDWHLRRRPDRFIKDPHSRYRPHRQRRPSPPRHSRSESNHIITIQSNATQPLPVKTQQTRDNQTQYQQPWANTQYNQPTNLAVAYPWSMQNMQQNVGSGPAHRLPAHPTDQAPVQNLQMMPQCNAQVSDPSAQMQNQQAYDQMMQYYYYQQQAPQQWQQQQYWLQLQYQQQLAQGQASMQMQQPPAQAPMLIQQLPAQAPQQIQQQQGQAPMQMQQSPVQAPMLIQQQQQEAQVLQQQETHAQPQPGTQAPLLQQQQLQQLLELQQLRKQQQAQQEKDQKQQQPAPSSPQISI